MRAASCAARLSSEYTSIRILPIRYDLYDVGRPEADDLELLDNETLTTRRTWSMSNSDAFARRGFEARPRSPARRQVEVDNSGRRRRSSKLRREVARPLPAEVRGGDSRRRLPDPDVRGRVVTQQDALVDNTGKIDVRVEVEHHTARSRSTRFEVWTRYHSLQ